MSQSSTARILLAEDTLEMRDVMRMCIETQLGLEVVECASGAAAIELLQAGEQFAGIVSDFDMQPGNGGDLFLHVLREKIGIPFVLCSSERPDNLDAFRGKSGYGYVGKVDMVGKLAPTLAEQLKTAKPTETATGAAAASNPSKESDLPAKKKGPDSFFRVRLETLYKCGVMPCPLYVRLSATKYIKIMLEEDPFGQEDLDKYTSKSVEYLFIDLEDFERFVSGFMGNIAPFSNLGGAKIRDPKDMMALAESVPDDQLRKDLRDLSHAMEKAEDGKLDIQESYSVSKAIHESVQEAVQTGGFSEEVQAIAKAAVDTVVKSLAKLKSLDNLLEKLQADPESYISSHSMMLAHLSSSIATMMSWSSESTYYKLSMAAFLHDITLEHQALARCRNPEEAKELSLEPTPKEMEHFINHPQKGYDLVKLFREIPPDVDSILMQHHERPDGTGFPLKLAHNRISPLSSVFIIAHDLVQYIFDHPDGWEMSDFLKEYAEEYSFGHFRRIHSEMAKHEKKRLAS